VWAVVVAGGSGTRFGRAKQFDLLGGRPVVEWSVAAARTVAAGVVLVVPAGYPGASEGATAGDGLSAGTDVLHGADVVVEGGATRSSSVRRGLEAVPDSTDVVIVHDAARPLASAQLFAAVIEPLLGEGSVHPDGVICAVAVRDTLKRLDHDGVTVACTLDRSELVAVQTPQAFRAKALRRAHALGEDATDDAALVERLGGVVHVVAGEPRNLKLTVPEDLVVAEHLLSIDADAARRP
jgi:2-C-methyl-D-erythritol 4-phosphate cytidylyltransferase